MIITNAISKWLEKLLTEITNEQLRNWRQTGYIEISNDREKLIVRHIYYRKCDVTNENIIQQYGEDNYLYESESIIIPIKIELPVEESELLNLLISVLKSDGNVEIISDSNRFIFQSEQNKFEYKNSKSETSFPAVSYNQLIYCETNEYLEPLKQICKLLPSAEQCAEYNHICFIPENNNSILLIGGFNDNLNIYKLRIKNDLTKNLIVSPFPIIEWLKINSFNFNVGIANEYLIAFSNGSCRYFYNKPYLSLSPEIAKLSNIQYTGNIKTIKAISKNINNSTDILSIKANDKYSKLILSGNQIEKQVNIELNGISSIYDYNATTVKQSISGFDNMFKKIDCNSIIMPKLAVDNKGLMKVYNCNRMSIMSPIKREFPFPGLRPTIEIRPALMHYKEAKLTTVENILLNFLDLTDQIWNEPAIFLDILNKELNDKKILIDLGAFTYAFNNLKKARVDADLQRYINCSINFIKTVKNHNSITAITSHDWYKDTLSTNIKYYLELIEEVGDEKIIFLGHIGESMDVMKNFLSKYKPKFIGIGGSAHSEKNSRIIFTREFFRILYEVYGEVLKDVWVHGFGQNSFSFLDSNNGEGLLHRYPYNSADSSSWAHASLQKCFTTPWGTFSIETRKPNYWKRNRFHNEIKQFVESLPIITKDGTRCIEIEALETELNGCSKFNLEFLGYLGRGNIRKLGHLYDKGFLSEKELQELPPYNYYGFETLKPFNRFQPIKNKFDFRGDVNEQ